MNWLAALASTPGPCVLVTVAVAQGSVPREPGAKMLVGATTQFDTIGGGHLELQACLAARAMLVEGLPRRQFTRFALGPTLGQCCGGVVWLAFERLTAREQERLSQSEMKAATWRLVPLDSEEDFILTSDMAANLPVALPDLARSDACQVMQDEQGRRWLVEHCTTSLPHLYLFGAGHVGAALVRALADLPCRITWIDEREDQFPQSVPANVSIECTDTSQAVIEQAEARASFLVITHSHALDQQLAEAILRRDSFTWFGLIGSRTKRIQFERRLRARGIAEERLQQMVCPIGLPRIEGKTPAVIAASVCAQLLQVWEAQARQAADNARPDLRNRA